MRLQGEPFTELDQKFQEFVIEHPEFLLNADLPAIYPMVTMRQMEFWVSEGENHFQITEKLVSDSFNLKQTSLSQSNSQDTDILQRITL